MSGSDYLVYYLDEFLSSEQSLLVDTEYNLKVLEKTGAKETDFYSEGYKNIFSLCRRFSLIDVIYNKEKPFVILDDPFVNFDEEKLEKAKKLVKKLGENYQIIYFTCHESRKI